MFKVMAITGVGLALVAPTAYVSANPPNKKIQIDLLTVNGSGCPSGTTRVAMAPDNTAFTVTYSEYLAQVGVGAKPTDMRKNCQLVVNVHVPQGFTYAIAKADYRGYANLKSGAAALQRATYYFQGESESDYRSHHFKGPMNDNWRTSDATEVTKLVWAPCGAERNVNINTELRVNAGGSDTSKTTSFISMDSTDTSVSTVYHLSWKSC